MIVRERLRSFDGWKSRGRVVASGQRAIAYSDYGKPLFAESQTVRDLPVRRVVRSSSGYFLERYI